MTYRKRHEVKQTIHQYTMHFVDAVAVETMTSQLGKMFISNCIILEPTKSDIRLVSRKFVPLKGVIECGCAASGKVSSV